jgi:hypothetical protein
VTDNIVYRKTNEGLAELQSEQPRLDRIARRALIMIDGARAVVELSQMMRPGEAEAAIERLLEGDCIAEVGAQELPPGRVEMMPYASVPENFEYIKSATAQEMTAKLGAFAPTVIAEIETCTTALELRSKLRDMEDILVAALGEEEGRTMAHRIGAELTRLVPKNNLRITQRLRTLFE